MASRRDNTNLQQANRKLERKVKELKMQADDEHVNLQSERDQVSGARRVPDRRRRIVDG